MGKVRKSEFFGKKKTSPKIKAKINATRKNLLRLEDKSDFFIFAGITIL